MSLWLSTSCGKFNFLDDKGLPNITAYELCIAISTSNPSGNVFFEYET